MNAGSSFAIRLLQTSQFQDFLDWRSGGDAYTLEVLQHELSNFEAGASQIFVVLDKDHLIGTVQLDLNATKPADGVKSALITALEVRREYRRKGIGQLLMRHLEEVARDLGIQRLTLMVETDNQTAITFYSRLGYTEYGRSFWGWKDINYPTICLEKRL